MVSGSKLESGSSRTWGADDETGSKRRVIGLEICVRVPVKVSVKSLHCEAAVGKKLVKAARAEGSENARRNEMEWMDSVMTVD